MPEPTDWAARLGMKEGRLPLEDSPASEANIWGAAAANQPIGQGKTEEEHYTGSEGGAWDDNAMYSKMMNEMTGRYGSSQEDIEDLMSKVAYHESKGRNVYQTSGGPGAGLFQFERGHKMGGETALNYLNQWFDKEGMDRPEWASGWEGQSGFDAAKLTPQQQKMLFMANTRMSAGGNFRPENIKNTTDWWLDNHWKGPDAQRDARKSSFDRDLDVYNRLNRPSPLNVNKSWDSNY